MSSGVSINGTELSTLGAIVSRVEGLDDGLSPSYPSIGGPGLDGERRMTDEATIATRELVIRGAVKGATSAAVRDRIDQLKYLTSRRDLAIVTDRDTTRRFIGDRTGFVSTWPDYQLRADVTIAEISITITCPRPSAEATSLTTQAFTTNTSCPLGSWRTRPVITVLATGGGCTNPTITLKNAAGTTLATLVYDNAGGLALNAGESLEIDCETGLTRKIVSGTPSNAAKYRNDSSLFPIWLDPRDGDFLASSWPSLSGSVATGTATFSVSYRKRWE